MICDDIDELLSDLIDDALAQNDRAYVEAHLASCERCAESLRQLRRTVRFVQAHASVELPAGTPAGIYMDATRAMVSPGDDRDVAGLLHDVLDDMEESR